MNTMGISVMEQKRARADLLAYQSNPILCRACGYKLASDCLKHERTLCGPCELKNRAGKIEEPESPAVDNPKDGPLPFAPYSHMRLGVSYHRLPGLASAKKAWGGSWDQATEKSGMSRRSLQQYAAGKEGTTDERIAVLARVLGVSAAYLKGEEW